MQHLYPQFAYYLQMGHPSFANRFIKSANKKVVQNSNVKPSSFLSDVSKKVDVNTNQFHDKKVKCFDESIKHATNPRDVSSFSLKNAANLQGLTGRGDPSTISVNKNNIKMPIAMYSYSSSSEKKSAGMMGGSSDSKKQFA